ncbi:hypothetical protein Tco_1163749 [Tanacetum coccineum]|uniref:Uncharacterized protein n=1 Tax=Tanacetum coccineum TaxID=301880 RepID=A0ABQ5BI62_9ASTR
MKRWITKSRNSGSTGGIQVWIHGFGRKKDVDRSKEFMFAIQKCLNFKEVRLGTQIHDPAEAVRIHLDDSNTLSWNPLKEVLIMIYMITGLHKDGDADASFQWGLMFISAAGQSLCCWIHTAEDLLLSKGKTGLESKDCLGRTKIQDYALWEVIENGNSWASVPQTAQENGTLVTKMSMPVTAEEKTNKKNDVKARSLAIMLFPMT